MKFYSLGRCIVEEQQHGECRARYGEWVMSKYETVSRILDEGTAFRLSFFHYIVLSRIRDEQERMNSLIHRKTVPINLMVNLH